MVARRPAFAPGTLLLGLYGSAGRRLIFAALMPASLHLRLHLFELLFLLIVQSRLKTRLRVLLNGLRLAVTVLARQRLILEQRLHLLLAIRQNRFDLRLLIGSQIERLRQMLQLPVSVHATPVSLLLAAGGSLVLRVKSGARAKRE